MHSAACCTTEPARVTGAVAPASGMLTISAGTPARARSTRFWEANSDQIDEILGGELRPVQRRRRAHIEDGSGMLAKRFAASTFDGEQVQQRVQAGSRKSTGDDRLFRIPE